MTMTIVKLSYNSKLVPDPGLVLQTPLCRPYYTLRVKAELTRMVVSWKRKLYQDGLSLSHKIRWMKFGTKTQLIQVIAIFYAFNFCY